MPDATLIELTKEVRWKTLKLLENMDDAQAAFTAPPLNNSILWNAGHSLVVVEHLSFLATKLGSAAPFPAEWGEMFTGKNPAATATWPKLSDVVAELVDQRTRLLALIDTLSPDQLDRVVGDPPRSRTLRGMIVHGLHDEAGHQGEIHMLKKLWRLRG